VVAATAQKKNVGRLKAQVLTSRPRNDVVHVKRARPTGRRSTAFAVAASAPVDEPPQPGPCRSSVEALPLWACPTAPVRVERASPAEHRITLPHQLGVGILGVEFVACRADARPRFLAVMCAIPTSNTMVDAEGVPRGNEASPGLDLQPAAANARLHALLLHLRHDLAAVTLLDSPAHPRAPLRWHRPQPVGHGSWHSALGVGPVHQLPSGSGRERRS